MQSLLRNSKVPSREANPQPLTWQTWNLSIRLGYQINTGWLKNWPLYLHHNMRGGMVKWVLKQEYRQEVLF